MYLASGNRWHNYIVLGELDIVVIGEGARGVTVKYIDTIPITAK